MEQERNFPGAILNADLRLTHIPPPDAPYHPAISSFALTFDGYAYAGSGATLSALVERARSVFSRSGKLPEDLSLSEVRACLFLEQRSWRHIGELPDKAAMRYIHALLEAIRMLLPRE